MNLFSVKAIDNCWMESAHPADQLEILVENMQTTFAAIQSQMVEFSKLIIRLKHGPMTNIRQFRYTIQLPDGTTINCTVDAPSMESALALAEKYADDFSEYAAVTRIFMEEKR